MDREMELPLCSNADGLPDDVLGLDALLGGELPVEQGKYPFSLAVLFLSDFPNLYFNGFASDSDLDFRLKASLT